MKRRQHVRLPNRSRGFLGENNVDGLTDPIYQSGALREMRNYHQVGRGRLQKRQGWEPYVTATPTGAAHGIQSLMHFQFDNTSHLMATAQGKVYKLDSNGTSWTNLTGSLSLSSTEDRHVRSTMFNSNTNSFLIATDNNGPVWSWDGSAGTVTAMPTVTRASDVKEFKHRIFAINLPNRPTGVRWSDNNSYNEWSDGNVFDCSRESHGVALASLSADVMLVFHRRSIYAIRSDPAVHMYFDPTLVDGSTGCVARGSVVTYEGRTYFADDDGIYVVGDPRRPAKYISRAIEGYWNKLNKARLSEMIGFSRGEPWSEICWLVSAGGSGVANAVLIYSPAMASLYGDEFGWTIFDSSTTGALPFTSGVDYEDGNKVHHTLFGTSRGIVAKAFGNEENQTQYTDGKYTDANGDYSATGSGTAVGSVLKTGLLDMGYEGMKGLRETWVDLEIASDTQFNLSVNGIEEDLVTETETTIGASGMMLGDIQYDQAGDPVLDSDGEAIPVAGQSSFMLGESFLVGSGTAQEQFQTEGSSRYFQFGLTESNVNQPHTVSGIHFLFTPRGMRIK